MSSSKDLDISSLYTSDIKPLFNSDPQYMLSVSNDLYTLDFVLCYLNYGCWTSQSTIANLLNISQFAVSKRLASLDDKIYLRFLRPITNTTYLREYLNIFFPPNVAENLLIYYKTYSQKRLRFIKKDSFRVNKDLQYLKSLSKAKTEQEFLSMVKYNKTKMEEVLNEHGFNTIKYILTKFNDYYTHISSKALFGEFQTKQNDKQRVFKRINIEVISPFLKHKG